MRYGIIVTIAALAAPGVGRADLVTLCTGETLKGQITIRTGEALTLDHPVLGQLTIKASEIASIRVDGDEPQDAKTVPVQPPPTKLPAVPADLSLPPSSHLLTGWEGRLEAGASGSNGNTQSGNLRLGLRADKQDDQNRWALLSSYDYGKNDGQATRNQYNADLNWDRLFPESPWFTFVQGIYDFNDFRSWQYRVSLFAGLGRELSDSERLEVAAKIGGGVTKEFGGEKELRPEGMISTVLAKWKLTETQTLAGSATLYPDMAELGQYRMVAKLEWLIKLDRVDDLSLKFALEDEYESETEGEIKHNDLKYLSMLVYEF